MIYDRIVGECESAPPQADVALLTWDERRKRTLRVTTSQGREVGIRLDEGGLRCGLLLGAGDPGEAAAGKREALLWIGAVPEPVLSVAATSPREFAFAAHFIGNRHIPVWIADDELLAPEDRVLEEALRAHGIRVRRESRLLDERHYMVSGGGHSSHAHGRASEHGHVHGRSHVPMNGRSPRR